MGERYTPPAWMRHFVSWRLLFWLDKRLPTCWAGMTMWKLGYDGWEWWPDRTCWDGPKGREFDYCGKYQNKAELQKARRL